jgi:threonine/homoserine/homoserine lactone efflux protein
MRLAKIFALALLTGLSGAMMPGPLLALTIGQATAVGLMAAIWLVTGHALLELIVVLLLIAGLRAVLALPKVRGGIGLIGGAALLYMGVDMVRGAATVHMGTAAVQGLPWLRLILAGLAVSAANPFFTGWWATVGVGQLAQMAPRNPREYAAFYVGHEVSDYAWYVFVALLVVMAKQALHGLWYNWLVGLCGAAVMLLALWFLYRGVRLSFGRSSVRAS